MKSSVVRLLFGVEEAVFWKKEAHKHIRNVGNVRNAFQLPAIEYKLPGQIIRELYHDIYRQDWQLKGVLYEVCRRHWQLKTIISGSAINKCLTSVKNSGT